MIPNQRPAQGKGADFSDWTMRPKILAATLTQRSQPKYHEQGAEKDHDHGNSRKRRYVAGRKHDGRQEEGEQPEAEEDNCRGDRRVAVAAAHSEKPPSTAITVPVQKADSSLAR